MAAHEIQKCTSGILLSAGAAQRTIAGFLLLSFEVVSKARNYYWLRRIKDTSRSHQLSRIKGSECRKQKGSVVNVTWFLLPVKVNRGQQNMSQGWEVEMLLNKEAFFNEGKKCSACYLVHFKSLHVGLSLQFIPAMYLKFSGNLFRLRFLFLVVWFVSNRRGSKGSAKTLRSNRK